MITKSPLEESDSFLAQGAICVLRDENDFDSFFEDTLKAGHYKNKKESVEIMINSSRDSIYQLIGYDVDFATKNGEMLYTREGAHSKPRIAYHDDITGQEITQKLFSHVLKRKNITLLTNTTLLDIISDNNKCVGGIIERDDGKVQAKGIDITKRFPNIVKKWREEGYDPEKECIPVVPAQHYFMGGIDVDLNSKTSMEHLYAVGETRCNGVHGSNRLASNSLLETLVFGERAANDIVAHKDENTEREYNIDLEKYSDKKTLFEKYRSIVLEEIEKDRGEKERE